MLFEYYMNDADHTPSINELKLLIDNSNLEMEKRLTKSINEAMTEQNGTYLTQIVTLNKQLGAMEIVQAQHTESIKGFKGLVATASAVSATLGGLVGFFIAQLTNMGGK